MTETGRLLIGAMSGTSADGVDVALVRISGRGAAMKAALLHRHHRPYDQILRRAIINLRTTGTGALREIAWITREVSIIHAAAVNELMLAAHIGPADIAGIAAHGQTVFHDPPDTMQWLDPALIAAETGCAVVSDFRRADCAAGGQGAPLVPFADYCLFRDPRIHRVLLNIGGIANLTFLPAGVGLESVIAFDTGPGNCICDHLARSHEPSGGGFDEGGKLAAGGTEIRPFIACVVSNSYFSQSPPKSTDGPAMIKLFADGLAELGRSASVLDLLRTACAITAESIALSVKQFLRPAPQEIIVSGGGAKNETMMGLLRKAIEPIALRTTEELGVPGEAKEAMAFALLGAATLDNEPANVPTATGARRAVVLGAVTPKP